MYKHTTKSACTHTHTNAGNPPQHWEEKRVVLTQGWMAQADWEHQGQVCWGYQELPGWAEVVQAWSGPQGGWGVEAGP